MPVSELENQLSGMLKNGLVWIGQLVLRWIRDEGGYELCHEKDFGGVREALDVFHCAEDAREIAKYSEEGRYRVLKSGRDLRGGWMIRVASVREVLRAVDLIYPAAMGQWLALEQGKIRVIPLRETLNRQKGMYRNAQRISDAGIARIVEGRCRASCLRRVLWPEGRLFSNESLLIESGYAIPLVCSEACQLLVTDAAREVEKGMCSREQMPDSH